MKCENRFCIYWNKNECILEEIELDCSGMCESCIYIDIDEVELNTLRKVQLDKVEELQPVNVKNLTS